MLIRVIFVLLVVCTAFPSAGQGLKEEFRRLDSLAALYHKDDVEKAIDYNLKALQIARELNDSLFLKKSVSALASSYSNRGNFHLAIQYYDTAMLFAANAEDSATIFIDKGAIAVETGHPDEAMNFFMRSRELLKSQSSLRKAKLYNEIGLLYRSLREYDQALRIFKEKIELEKEFSYGKLYRSYMNVGLMYLDLNEYDSAIVYFNLSYEGMDKENEIYGLSIYYNNMGSAYSDMQQFGLAKPYAEKAIYYKEKLGNKNRLANSYNLLSFIHLGLGENEEAAKAAALSLQTLDSMNVSNVRFNALKYLTEARLRQNDTTGVNRMIYEIIDLKNTIFDKEKTAAFSEMATKYDLERKEQELFTRQQELEIARGKIERQKLQRNSLIAGLLLLALIAGLIFRNQRLKVKANQELERKNAEIRGLNEAKSRWFINVSHELRTPLTLVKGPLTQATESEKLNPRVRETLLLAERNLQNLESLINEILDLSKMENGRITLNNTILEYSQLVREASAAFASLASENKISYKVTVDDEIYIKGDYSKLHKAVTNLIANAMKFTDEEGEVSVSLQQTTETIILRVCDTGAGIPSEDLPFIFDRFYQSAANKTARSGGTGIGLALTREIARLHGGEVNVESAAGEGSTFLLSLPHDLQTDEVPETTGSKVIIPDVVDELIAFSRFNNGKPSLLLVDDNKDMRTFIRSFMEGDYHVTEAGDGKEALRKITESKPDLILTDIMMPGMDGIDMIKKLKENEVWKKIPLIALTALASESDKLYTLQIGIDDYLVKPFNPGELKIRAFNLINNSIVRKNASEEAESLSHEDELLNKLHREVENNLSETSFNVSRLADVAAMSERQLYRTVKQISGLTPSQFVREIRLRKAMVYLEQNKFATIAELSHAVGFEYPGYFTSVFEKRFGSKPAEYMTI